MNEFSRVLGRLQAHHYQFRFFGDPPGPAGSVYLRHDVDLSLAPALRLAELEAGLGVRASYFFLVRSGLYNLLSREGRVVAGRIAELGHAVGLHFDASYYDEPGPGEVAEELRVLGSCVPGGSPVISLHRPPAGLEAIDKLAARLGHPTTYDPPFTREIAYHSDSSGRTERLTDAVAEAAPRRANLQLLVHPFWWDGPAAGIPHRMGEFVRAAGPERHRLVDQEVMPGFEVA